jgi:hypothetical protein
MKGAAREREREDEKRGQVSSEGWIRRERWEGQVYLWLLWRQDVTRVGICPKSLSLSLN